MWQSVPWFVAGGIHAPEVARLLAYAATGGFEGVLAASDLKVAPTAVPGSNVQVLPGAAVVPNRQVGGGQQSYVARNPTADVVAVSATGSGSGRSDLVVVRVEDPQYPGAPEPGDPTVGPYVFTRIIEGVPAGTTSLQQVAGHENDAAITLARIDLPASTATVLEGHIVDLRRLTQSAAAMDRYMLTAAIESEQRVDTTAAGGQQWPTEAAWQVNVPTWATKAKVRADWGQVVCPSGNAKGTLFVRLTDGTTVFDSRAVGFDTASGTSRESFFCADTFTIPPALRGKQVDVQLRAKLTSGSASERIRINTASAAALQLEFEQAAV